MRSIRERIITVKELEAPGSVMIWVASVGASNARLCHPEPVRRSAANRSEGSEEAQGKLREGSQHLMPGFFLHCVQDRLRATQNDDPAVWVARAEIRTPPTGG